MLMIIVKEYLDDYYDNEDGDVDNDDLWETWVQNLYYRSPSQRWKVLSASYSDNSYYDAVKMMTVMINVDADC